MAKKKWEVLADNKLCYKTSLKLNKNSTLIVSSHGGFDKWKIKVKKITDGKLDFVKMVDSDFNSKDEMVLFLDLRKDEIINNILEEK